MARVDVELQVAICEPCKEAEQHYGNAGFCEKCGTRHITGRVLFELDDGAVQRALFIPSPEPEAQHEPEAHDADQGTQ